MLRIAGGGMNISPVGFLVVSPNNVRMINVDSSNTPLDKLIDYAPEAIEKILNKFCKKDDDDKDVVIEAVKYTTNHKNCVLNDLARPIITGHGYAVK